MKWLELEVEKLCNLKCAVCPRRNLKHKHPHLTPEGLKYILESTPTPKAIYLIGEGEPLLNPFLNTLLEITNNRGIKVCLTTNGMLVTKDIVGTWRDLNLWTVGVSLDSLEQKTLDKLRRGASVAKIKESITILVQKGISTKVNFLLQSENQHELGNLQEFCKTLGVDLNVIHYFCVQEKAQIPEVTQLEEHRRYCAFQPYITIEGDVFTCPFIPMFSKDGWFIEGGYGPEIRLPTRAFKWGNIFEKPFQDIWNSMDYVPWRLFFLHTKGPLPLKSITERNPEDIKSSLDYCRICPIRWGLSCEA